MAGLYPDVPSWRIAWDKDGTQVYWNGDNPTDTPIGPLTSGQMTTLNDENDSGVDFSYPGANYNYTVFMLFPQPMNLYGAFVAASRSSGVLSGPQMYYYSTNTTNGIDGTWTALVDQTDYDTVNPYWKTGIASFTALNAKGFKFMGGNLYTKTIRAIHLFGEIASGNPDRLEIWHPTSDVRAPATWFDMAECPRSSSQDIQFRIKNMSPTLTANSITVSLEANTDTTPSVPAAHFLSTDGVTFLSSATVASILPGNKSAILTLRRTTPSNAVLSVFAFRMKALAASWS